jgi:hypothetical protein
MASPTPRVSYLRRVAVAVLAGVPGIVALVGYLSLTIPMSSVPAGLTRPLVAVASAITPFLLLVLACLLGVFTAPRVGLRFYLLDRLEAGDAIWPRLRGDLSLAASIGFLGAIVVILVDVALAPAISVELPQSTVAATRLTIVDVLLYVPVRFLYGGVTEELLLRFGLLSAVAYGGWRLTGRRTIGPSSRVMWAAIAVSAVLFGVGHLPALARQIGLTPLLVARTVLLNAILGVAFGWLYWRRSLEAAMVAHVVFHVVIVALSIGQLTLP